MNHDELFFLPAAWPWMTWSVAARLMTSSIISQKCGKHCSESLMTSRWVGNQNQCFFNPLITSDVKLTWFWLIDFDLTVVCLYFRSQWGRLQTWLWKHSVRWVCLPQAWPVCILYVCIRLCVCTCGHPGAVPCHSLSVLSRCVLVCVSLQAQQPRELWRRCCLLYWRKASLAMLQRCAHSGNVSQPMWSWFCCSQIT